MFMYNRVVCIVVITELVPTLVVDSLHGMGNTVKVEEYHHIYSMGSGVHDASSNAPVSLSKKNSNDFSVDFWYNATTSELDIALRYKLRAVTNSAKIKNSSKREYNIMVNQCQST